MDSDLFRAAGSGDEQALEGITADEYMKQETSQKNSVLHVAVLHNQRRIVERILEAPNRSLLYRKNADGDTALHLAARLGLHEIARVLIDSVVLDFNLKRLTRKANRRKDSALHDAARNDHLRIVELLIQEDRELALLTNNAGESPLFLALERKFFGIARHLLDNTENFSLSGRHGMNALHLAVVYLHTERTGEGPTAAYPVLFDLVNDMTRNYTLALGEQDNLGWTSLHYAAHYGVEEVVESFLTTDRSSAYKRDREGMSAFHVATEREEVNIMRRIMALCPDVYELLSYNGQNALHVAVTNRNNDAVEYLLTTLSSNSLLNQQDKDGNTPFHLAAIIEDYEILDMLLSILPQMFLNNERVNLNVMNMDGLTVMDIVQSSGTLEEARQDNLIASLRGLHCVPGRQQQLIERNIQLQNVENMVVPQQELEEAVENRSNPFSMFFLQPFINPHLAEKAAQVDIVLATLIATVTFAAAFQVPGGYNSTNGFPILRKNNCYTVFIIFDSLAFGLSSSSIFLHFLGSMGTNGKNLVFLQIAKLTTFYSILAMVGTFFSALYLLSDGWNGICTAAYVSLGAFLIGPLYLRYFDFLLWIKEVLPNVFYYVLLLILVVVFGGFFVLLVLVRGHKV